MWPYPPRSRNAEGTCSPKRPQPRRRLPPEVLTNGEVVALLDACAGPPVPRARNRALVALLYRTGLRISEALALEPKDLNAPAGSVAVLRGKGGTWRVAGIDGGALEVVGEWLSVRATLDLPARAPLFCTATGQLLAPAYVRRLMARLGRQAGIGKRVHAHGLRHTHAAQLRTEGVDIGIISRQLGHASIVTTARYLDHIAPLAVVEAVRSRAW